MRKIAVAVIILTSLVAFSDPLADIIWMVGTKSSYLYLHGGTFFGVEYVKAFEIPVLPSDPFLSLTGCDVDFLKAIIRNESNFRIHATSQTGALGVAQIVRSTAKWLKVSNPYNPISSSFATCKYLKYLSRKFKSKTEILWAYHDGEGAVRKRGPSEVAKNYAKVVMRFYEKYRSDKKWTWFRDRVLLKISLDYFPLLSYDLRAGGAVSLLGVVDLDGGYLLSDAGNGPFLKTYLRIFHDLALVFDVEPGGKYLGTSFWDINRGIEVLVGSGCGKARLQVGNFGMDLTRGRISIFYRKGL